MIRPTRRRRRIECVITENLDQKPPADFVPPPYPFRPIRTFLMEFYPNKLAINIQTRNIAAPHIYLIIFYINPRRRVHSLKCSL